MTTIDLPNARWAITLGKGAGELADALREFIAKGDSLVDTIRLALLNLRMLLVARTAGWEIVFRTKDGEEFTYDIYDPQRIVPVPKKSAAPPRPDQNGAYDIRALIAPKPIPFSALADAMQLPEALVTDGVRGSVPPIDKDKLTERRRSR